MAWPALCMEELAAGGRPAAASPLQPANRKPAAPKVAPHLNGAQLRLAALQRTALLLHLHLQGRGGKLHACEQVRSGLQALPVGDYPGTPHRMEVGHCDAFHPECVPQGKAVPFSAAHPPAAPARASLRRSAPLPAAPPAPAGPLPGQAPWWPRAPASAAGRAADAAGQHGSTTSSGTCGQAQHDSPRQHCASVRPVPRPLPRPWPAA